MLVMPDIDFGRRVDDYVRYRPGFPEAFYAKLEPFVPLRDIEALDLGTGPGVIALELAARGAFVIGMDISHDMIDAAQIRAVKLGLQDRARFIVGEAERTDLSSSSFDLITAGQCWRWLRQPDASQEAHRLLRPGGYLIVAHFDYLPLQDDIAHRTEQLIVKFNPDWPLAGKDCDYTYLIAGIVKAGFDYIDHHFVDEGVPFTHEAWRGRMRTCNGVGSGQLTERQVKDFDRDLQAMLTQHAPDEPVTILHRVFTIIVRTPNAT